MASLLALIILILIAFYIPPIQDAIFKKAVTEINKGDLLHISYEHLRIGFPAHLKGEKLEVDLPGEMDASLGYIDADIKLLPLMGLDISSNEIDIQDAKFRLGNPDSTIYLNAAIDTFLVKDISVKLKDATIDFARADVDGPKVTLLIAPNDKEEIDTTKNVSSKSFVINANDLNMHRVDYFMSIKGTIDSLEANIDNVRMRKGEIDLNKHTVKADDFDIEDILAKYIFADGSATGDENRHKEIDEVDKEPVDSLPWTITVNHIDLNARKALYAKNGMPKPNYFSPDYIEASDFSIEIDSFYNCLQNIKVPIKKFAVEDFYGMTVNAHGVFAIDSSLMTVNDFNLLLPGSNITLNALMGLQSKRFPTPAVTPVSINMAANIAPGDISVFVPSMKEIINGLPTSVPILLDIDMNGTMDNVKVDEFIFELPRYLKIGAHGWASGFNSPDLKHLSSNLTFEGQLIDTHLLKPTVVEAKLGKDIRIVPFDIRGNMSFRNGNGTADIKIQALTGKLSLDGKINFGKENYDIDLKTANFPVEAILPKLDIENVSARISAKGHRFNPLMNKAALSAQLNIDSMRYKNLLLHSIQLNADIDKGDANIILASDMPSANLNVRLNGNISGNEYIWNLNGNIMSLELMNLGLSKVPNGGSLRIDGNLDFIPDSMLVQANINLPSLQWTIDDRSINTRQLQASFDADRSGTAFDLSDRDLELSLASPEPLDTIMKSVTGLKAELDTCFAQSYFNVDNIIAALPKFDMEFSANKNNILASWLAQRGESFDSVGVSIINNSRLSLDAIIRNYHTPKYMVDSITARMWDRADSLYYDFHLYNSPMSPGDWANVKLFGRLGGNEVDVRFNQKNHAGKTGFLLGFDGQLADSTITIKFVPVKPTVAYQQWEINPDNFISLNYGARHLDANLSISHGNSGLRLYTDHIDGNEEQEAINLQLTEIQIGDWISLNPYANPMKGILNGRFSLSHEGRIFTGDGRISLDNFIYGKQRVGSFDLGVDVTTTPHGFIHANAALDVDSVKVLNIYGVLNDTTQVEPFMLKLDIDSLPLKVANPFLSDAGIKLSGDLNGTMTVTGTPSTPVFNGYIEFDKTGVNVEMLGTTYQMSDKKIPVDTGIVLFDNYGIKAVNNNPLVIDGTVNMHDVLNPVIDLTFTAKNTQIVGTDRARGKAEIYGKAFINLDADVKGDMSYLKINAAADVLNTTNVTYVLTGGTQGALTSRSNSDLVKFVNFADSSMVSAADSMIIRGTVMNIDALLSIMRGATISVDLSADGKNKVQLEPSGDLDFSMDVLGAQHLTGRLNINGGFARYTPPLMSEKLFNFQEGSYVDFTGNIMNPRLNIHAIDRLRANVTQEGQNSRLIYFNVGLDITGTLENMDVAFNLSTDDDLTVENELESMSPSQRASKAMNLLLTNMYTGPGTTADANMGANALYSFLGSTLNSWAANNIKFVDLSFGVNQYDNTTNGVTSQATSYSYNVSKSLFDDRFKISIGGNYTTDADADENFAQNLISDVSLEYILNPNGTMSVKIFRHAGFESILEGEVVQTGVGFTYRKRLNSLRQMFWFLLPEYYRYNNVVAREEAKLQKEEAGK